MSSGHHAHSECRQSINAAWSPILELPFEIHLPHNFNSTLKVNAISSRHACANNLISVGDEPTVAPALLKAVGNLLQLPTLKVNISNIAP